MVRGQLRVVVYEIGVVRRLRAVSEPFRREGVGQDRLHGVWAHEALELAGALGA